MLLNNFFTIDELSTTENGLQAIIQFNPEDEIFKGHFPNQPVVPGVCMVQIVKEFMSSVLAAELLFSKGHQLKFLQLVVPANGEAIQVNISWKVEDNSIKTTADFKKEQTAVFKLSGVFTKR